jgi:hypothetical protein
MFCSYLKVTRTIGDFEVKLEGFRGNSNLVIPEPDVFAFELKDNYDFLLLASTFYNKPPR